MKKIEFCKEVRPDGVNWYTAIDGKYVDNSLELTEEKGRRNFEYIKLNGSMKVVEIIETCEI